MRIHAAHIQKARHAVSPEDLIPVFQKAIQIEHATIPPYLTALYSLKKESNAEIHRVIESVVIEEMLHVTICANIINALGGTVSLTHAGFMPEYPAELPMGIAEHLQIGLESYSPELMRDSFMKIEMPDHPLDENEDVHERVAHEHHHTIGLLYRLLQKNIRALPDSRLPGDPGKQVVSSLFTRDMLFPVHTIHDAVKAINIIIDQGEGSSHNPIDKQHEPGHYYRFAELYHGRKICADPTADKGYAYLGDPIEFDREGVIPLFPNTRLSMLDPKSEGWYHAEKFYSTYQRLLMELESVFNGNAAGLDMALMSMRDLKQLAANLVAVPMQDHPELFTGLVFNP